MPNRIFSLKASAFAFAAAFLLLLTPRAEAYSWTETECMGNYCIVYGYVRTEDANGNFTGYARYEVQRYWRDDVISIDP